MKFTTLIDSALLAISIALVPGIANAQTVTNNSEKAISINSNTLRSPSPNTSYLKPFDTAFLAYQGDFKKQGIPSGSSLVFEYQIGNLTALDVVNAAVQANKLPAQALNDTSYLNAVELQLTSLQDNLSYE